MAREKRTVKNLTPEEKLEQALVPVEEQPYPVPENWCWVRLSALVKIISKGTTPSGGKSIYTNTGVSFLRVENLNEDGTISHENIAHIPEEVHLNLLKRSVLEEKDILISIAGTLGKTGIVRKIDLPLNTNQALAFVRLIDTRICEKYIKYSIDSPIMQNSLLRKAKVTSIPNLTLQIIENCSIPLAPTSEQQRIVDCIERLFVKLDEAKEKVQVVVDGFETRKAAILHNVRYFEVFDGELEKFQLKEKDILIVEGNGSGNEIGRCAIWHNELPVCIHQNHIIRLRRKTNFSLPEYVLLFLNSPSGKNVMKSRAKTTAGLFNLSTGKIRSIPIPYPSLSEQIEIVRVSSKLIEKEKRVKEAAETALDQIDIMKKSILARAFRGELGTNDSAGESAVELLKSTL